MPWPQTYDPLQAPVLSTLLAALPVAVLLGGIAIFRLKAHVAALLGLTAALSIALFAYRMPPSAAAGAFAFGAASGLFPIGWIVLNLIFLYQLTVERGWFAILRSSLVGIAPDPRIQVILIAFSFGAFFEGAAGFGTPVAVTAAILMGLGFRPLEAAGLSLIANTAPVAFGALGTPLITLANVTGLDLHVLSAAVGRQLCPFGLIIPFWVVWAYSGWKGVRGVWPAALAAGSTFALFEYVVSTYFGPQLVGIVASLASIAALVTLLQFWRPKTLWTQPREEAKAAAEHPVHPRGVVIKAWLPWVLLTAFVFAWGLPQVAAVLGRPSLSFAVPGLNLAVQRMPPVVAHPTPEKAVFAFNYLAATGTAIFAAAIASGFVMGYTPLGIARVFLRTFWIVRHSLVTIAAMLALGYVTRYAGIDATLGLALAKSGFLYPLFGTLLGWLGVALTGSDTASNVLFGGLQAVTSRQLGLNPVLMCAANSSGGVMGKMIDTQSIVVASTATNWYGHESSILRYVFFHSLALAVLVGLLVFAQVHLSAIAPAIVH